MMYGYFKRRDSCRRSVEASQFGHVQIFAVSLLMGVHFLELDRNAHASCMRACDSSFHALKNGILADHV